jgi:hypothetical protein
MRRLKVIDEPEAAGARGYSDIATRPPWRTRHSGSGRRNRVVLVGNPGRSLRGVGVNGRVSRRSGSARGRSFVERGSDRHDVRILLEARCAVVEWAPVRAQDFVNAWRRVVDPKQAFPVATICGLSLAGSALTSFAKSGLL